MEGFAILAQVEMLKEALRIAPHNKALIRRIKKKLKAGKLNKPYDADKYLYVGRSWEPEEKTDEQKQSDDMGGYTSDCCD